MMNSNHGNHLANYLRKNAAPAAEHPQGPDERQSGDSVQAQVVSQEQIENVDALLSDAVGGNSVVGHGFSDLPGAAETKIGPQSYLEDFQTYVVPVPSTDYKGLEKFDVRIANREWRLENLYYVVDEDGQLVKFKLREAQKWLLRNMHWKNIILKARQLGFTTFICIFLLDYALFNRNRNIGIIAHTQKDATVIFRKVKVAWDNMLPELKEFLGLRAIGDSKSEYEFTNGSFMMISTSLRSGTYQAVLITEFGKLCAQFPEKAEEIITGTLPAANRGLVFVESTAEGEDGHFYDMCMEAMELETAKRPLTFKDWKFFFFPWYKNPANQVEGEQIEIDSDTTKYLDEMEQLLHIQLSTPYRNWYFLEKKQQKRKMKQEHPSTPQEAFLSSGNKLFAGELVDVMIQRWTREPLRVDGDFMIYTEFVKGHLYGLGADVSQGVSRDSSTITVIDYTTGEVVLTYKSNTIDPVSFAYDIKKAAIMYGGCLAAPEANNVGMTTCVTLNNIYSNVYLQTREDLLETQITQKLGWLTTSATKPLMMNELSQSMEDSELKIPDRGVLLEAKKFNKEDALVVQVNSNTTRHFDKLIATAIAWQMRKHATRGQMSQAQQDSIAAHRAKKTSPNRLNTYR